MRRSAEPPPADVHAAVEEDHDQRHDRDPLHGADRDVLLQVREEVGHDGGTEQEQRRGGHREPAREANRHQREREATGQDQQDQPEVGDLAQSLCNSTALTVSLRFTQPRQTVIGNTVQAPMRRFLVPLLLIGAAFPAVGFADRAPTDGTLAVRDGRGKIQMTVKGSLIGRFGNGSLTIEELSTDEESEPVVRGYKTFKWGRNGNVRTYTGKNVRFRLIGGRYKVTLAA